MKIFERIYQQKIVQQISSNDFWSKLAKNFVIALFGTSGASIINFITLLIIVRILGINNYGLFVLAQQYMIIIDGLVKFQSWQGVIKFGSEALVESDDDRLASIFKFGFMIDLISAVAGIAIALIAVPIVGKMMQWDSSLIILAAVFSLEIIFHIEGTPTGILRLLNKFNLTAIQSISMALIRLVVVGIYAIIGYISLQSFVILYVCLDVIKYISLAVIAAFVVSKRLGLKKVFSSKMNNVGRGFFRYTMWSNIGLTADIPIKYFDVYIISNISVEMVAIYKVFKQFIQVFSMLMNPISQAILPQFSELVARRKNKQAYKVVLKIRNIILMILLPITILCSIAAKSLFNALLGQEYATHVLLFVLLLFINDYALSYVGLHPFFSAIGKVKEDFFIILISNSIYLASAFILVDYVGIYGIVYATAIQYVITIISKTLITRYYIQKCEE